MRNITRALIIQLLVGTVFALHGKIVFYDGTYVVGKVTKVDESTVYIVPIGLDTSEGVLVGNIDSLKLENGMVPVINSAVKYFYQNGEFLANEDDWMDEYGDFQYDDYALIQEEYKYEESRKTAQQYYQLSISGGFPILAANSMKEHESYSGPKEKLYFNLSGSFQLPYYPTGALDISPGMRFMTFGWENSYNGQWKCLQLVTFASIDFKPIFYFLPKGIHTSLDIGFSYNMAFDSDQDSLGYFGETVQPALPGQEYGGVGFNIGGSLDYWLDELPIAIRLYGQGYFIPQAPPFPELRTMFGSIGLSVVVVLKRH
ncbi:MAG: hypothetical protein CMG05_04120 [Candidatus Marinimicrobia bacterium]|nr:hypothetical protein [Candidatus Neomarinimicrobiota bacterium]